LLVFDIGLVREDMPRLVDVEIGYPIILYSPFLRTVLLEKQAHQISSRDCFPAFHWSVS